MGSGVVEGSGFGVVSGGVVPGGVGVLFSGQGSQWLGMGRGLYERFPVFAGFFDEVVAHLDEGLVAVLWGGDEGELERTVWQQQGLFALQVALFRWVESLGVAVDCVGGHSVGEVAAAHVAGVLSLEDACGLVRARAGLMEGLPAGGVMVAVEASEEEVVPLLGGGVSLGAVNGPGSVVLSGVEDEVLEVVAGFEALGRRVRRLRVSRAFHSVLMDPVLGDFRRVVEGVGFGAARVPVVSVGDVGSVDYWVGHVREPVRFVDVVRGMERRGVSTFVEVGPDGVLSGLAAGCVRGEGAAFVPLLRKGRGEEFTAVGALAQLWCRGAGVDWRGVLDTPAPARTGPRDHHQQDQQQDPHQQQDQHQQQEQQGPERGGAEPAVWWDLPTYPFQRRRYWLERTGHDTGVARFGQDPAGHPLLAAVL
ncbi:acyltransferase domain-containing protein, partial [Streptomyces fimbriatus]|uniref:acyltransferase domain-containing protein n=1 Tax=Streptomyces fimbriatus TaxID=68197 RepID=UPI0031CDFA87